MFDRRLVTPGAVSGLAAGYGSLWAVGAGRVLRLDPRTGKTLRTFRTPGTSGDGQLAVGDGAVWVTEGLSPAGGGWVYQISPCARTARRFTSLKSIAFGMTVTRSTVWVATLDRHGEHLVALDPDDGTVRPKVLTLPGSIVSLVHGAGYVWAQVPEPGLTLRVNPETSAERHIRPNGSLNWGHGSLWVTGQNAIKQVDPSTMRVTHSSPVPRAFASAFSGGSAWALSTPRSRSQRAFKPIAGTARLRQVDPRDDRTVGPAIKVDMENPTNIVGSKDMLWIFDDRTQELMGLRVR